MSVFEFTDYKAFLKSLAKKDRKKVRGFFTALAKTSQMQLTNLSAVMRLTDKHLTLDQAASIADYLNFSDLETEYLLCMVSIGRAYAPALKRHAQKKLIAL